MPREIDYTAMRLGRRTPDGRIVVCPGCGRRGAIHGRSDGKYPFVMIYHAKAFDLIAWGIHDYCSFGPRDEHWAEAEALLPAGGTSAQSASDA